MGFHEDTAEILEDGPMARPYLLTGGRVRSDAGDLAVEAMVSAAEGAAVPADSELAEIFALCATPNSIAEISAKRAIPIGVARVLVADMWGAGILEILQTTRSDDIAIVRRLLDGIRKR
ncbi:MAG: DUF742 domain-containing protein [Acidimicrobiales bacterium]|nr:DUF742 domain-containing protein [Acidimicrobiales bacterium]